MSTQQASVPPTLLKWREFLADCPSPATWVDLGWYFAVSAALQRRVWYADQDFNPTFLNIYALLVGPPGCGKGLVLNPVSKFFTDASMRFNLADRNRELNAGEEVKMKIPLGPSDGSYQAIMDEMVANTQVYRYTEPSGLPKSYIHASLALILDELNSLFKRHSNEVPNFLLKTYDCRPHDYKTRHQGRVVLQKTCVALLAGCTNTMLKDAARYGIFEDGFVSRCIFAFEFEPRFYSFDINNNVTEGQKIIFAELQEHIQKLTGMYGRLEFTAEALDYLRSTFRDVDIPRIKAARSKMQTYFARKAIHLKKLAALAHFSRSLDMMVSLEDAMEARRLLDVLEPNMAIGFNAVGRNELTPVMRDIRKAITSTAGGMSRAELMAEFCAEVKPAELDEVLLTLTILAEIREHDGKYVRR